LSLIWQRWHFPFDKFIFFNLCLSNLITVIFISKWEIWKIRNKVKYNQSRIGDQTIFNTWKSNFKKYLQCTLQTSHINELIKTN
jgi:hypothetical protein